MLGDSAAGAVNKAVGKIGPHRAKEIVGAIPMSAINRVNKVLGPRFVTKYGTQQSVLVLGKQLPLGIGMGLGGAGNHIVGRGIIRSARKVFGDPPTSWPDEVAGTTGADQT